MKKGVVLCYPFTVLFDECPYLKMSWAKLYKPYFQTTKSCLPPGYSMSVAGTPFSSQKALRRELNIMRKSSPPQTIQSSLFCCFMASMSGISCSGALVLGAEEKPPT